MLTRNEVTGEWRRLHKELLDDLYCLMICTAQLINARRVRLAEHVAR